MNIIKNDSIWQFQDILTNGDEIINILNSEYPWEDYNNDGGGSTLVAKTSKIYPEHKEHKVLFDIFARCIDNYVPAIQAKLSSENLDCNKFITRVYYPGSYMHNHYDKYSYVFYNGEDVEPLFTVILYINDDYEGGEVVFTESNLSIKPKAGTVLMFPSYLHHQVNEVISGERYMTQTYLYEKPLSEYQERDMWVYDEEEK